jgi:hypothetical protein
LGENFVKITKSQLKQLIKEETNKLMVDPRITKWGHERLADLEKEKEEEREEESNKQTKVDLTQIHRVAQALIDADRKIHDAPENSRDSASGGLHWPDVPWEEYTKTAKLILMGHPKGWNYRTPAIEKHIMSLSGHFAQNTIKESFGENFMKITKSQLKQLIKEQLDAMQENTEENPGEEGPTKKEILIELSHLATSVHHAVAWAAKHVGAPDEGDALQKLDNAASAFNEKYKQLKPIPVWENLNALEEMVREEWDRAGATSRDRSPGAGVSAATPHTRKRRSSKKLNIKDKFSIKDIQKAVNKALGSIFKKNDIVVSFRNDFGKLKVDVDQKPVYRLDTPNFGDQQLQEADLVDLVMEELESMFDESMEEKAIETAWDLYCNGQGAHPIDNEGNKLPVPPERVNCRSQRGTAKADRESAIKRR